MKFFNWFKSLWHRDAVAKATETARMLVAGLSNEQFQVIVDNVTLASKMPVSGLDKAMRVREIISSPRFTLTHGTPPWVQQGIDFASVIVQLAWVVAKLTKRI
jgi:chemotaxis signal transduction protein